MLEHDLAGPVLYGHASIDTRQGNNNEQSAVVDCNHIYLFNKL